MDAGDLFCKLQHRLARPSVTAMCLRQQHLNDCLGFTHAADFSASFNGHRLAQNLAQHWRQIALAPRPTPRIARLPLAKSACNRRTFVSDLAVGLRALIRCNWLVGHRSGSPLPDATPFFSPLK